MTNCTIATERHYYSLSNVKQLAISVLQESCIMAVRSAFSLPDLTVLCRLSPV